MKKLCIGLCILALSFSLQGQEDTTNFISEEVSQSSETVYQWISYRAKLAIETDEQDINCQLFVVNRIDSILYLNLNVAGIELARAVFTPSEMTFVNKMEKNYYQGDYGYIETLAGIPLDFNILQSLLNGTLDKIFDQPFSVEYENYITIDNFPFFQNFHFESPDMEIKADLKNIKFNTPGQTEITIPKNFKALEIAE